MSRLFLRPGHDPQRPDWLAGAPGLEPGNGGIKIQMVRVICQRAFRKNAEIRPQSDQEVSGNFGMQGRVAPCCDAPRPPKAEVTRSKSCRASTIFPLSARRTQKCESAEPFKTLSLSRRVWSIHVV